VNECKHVNELSGSIKLGQCLDWVTIPLASQERLLHGAGLVEWKETEIFKISDHVYSLLLVNSSSNSPLCIYILFYSCDFLVHSCCVDHGTVLF
jgi:hypothetical protein